MSSHSSLPRSCCFPSFRNHRPNPGQTTAPVPATDEFQPDPAWKKLGKDLWFDPAARRLILRTRVCLRDGYLEHLLCAKNTKEHESILVTEAPPRLIHAATAADRRRGRPRRSSSCRTSAPPRVRRSPSRPSGSTPRGSRSALMPGGGSSATIPTRRSPPLGVRRQQSLSASRDRQDALCRRLGGPHHRLELHERDPGRPVRQLRRRLRPLLHGLHRSDSAHRNAGDPRPLQGQADPKQPKAKEENPAPLPDPAVLSCSDPLKEFRLISGPFQKPFLA